MAPNVFQTLEPIAALNFLIDIDRYNPITHPYSGFCGQPDAPQAPPCPITLRAVSEAKIGGAVSPEAGVAGGDRMGWVHRV